MEVKNNEKSKRTDSEAPPKEMGAITNLGSRRERPFMASVYDSPMGYFRMYREAETCLLRHFLKKYRMMPGSICGNDALEAACTDFIYDLQQNGKLCENIKYISDSDIDDYNSVFVHRIENNKLSIPDDEIVLKSDNTQPRYKSAFNSLKELHDVPINQITTKNMQCILDDYVFKGYKKSTVDSMKVVYKYIFNYAMANGLAAVDYTLYLKMKPTEQSDTKIDKSTKKKVKKNKRIPFKQEETVQLYNDNSFESKIILIYIFTGMRPVEFIKMKISDIDLNQRIMIGGAKTEKIE